MRDIFLTHKSFETDSCFTVTDNYTLKNLTKYFAMPNIYKLFLFSAVHIQALPSLSELPPREHLAAAASQAGSHWKNAFLKSGDTIHGAARVVGAGTVNGARAVGSGVAGGARAVGRGAQVVNSKIKTGVGAGIEVVRNHPGVFIAGAGGVGVGAIVEKQVLQNKSKK